MTYSRKLTSLAAAVFSGAFFLCVPWLDFEAHAEQANPANSKGSQRQADGTLPTYLEYNEIQQLFSQYAIDHPEIVELMDLPWMQSQEGQPIIALKITAPSMRGHAEAGNSDHRASPREKPGIVITGGTHGDEYIGTEVLIRITDQLIQGYTTDARIQAMLQGSVVYVIPVTSPDSFHISRNVHGVDPNRVYPYPGNNNEPIIASARSMLKFFDTVRPQGSIDFHGVGGVIVHPWGHNCNPIEDPNDLARFTAAGSAMAMHNGYLWGGFCNTLYQAPGGSQDGYYYLYDTLAFSIETGASSKKPPETEIPLIFDQCRSAAWALIEYLIAHPDDSSDTSTSGDSTGGSETGATSGTDTHSTSDTGATGTGGATGTTGDNPQSDDGMDDSTNDGCRSTPTSFEGSLFLLFLTVFAGPRIRARAKQDTTKPNTPELATNDY